MQQKQQQQQQHFSLNELLHIEAAHTKLLHGRADEMEFEFN